MNYVPGASAYNIVGIKAWSRWVQTYFTVPFQSVVSQFSWRLLLHSGEMEWTYLCTIRDLDLDLDSTIVTRDSDSTHMTRDSDSRFEDSNTSLVSSHSISRGLLFSKYNDSIISTTDKYSWCEEAPCNNLSWVVWFWEEPVDNSTFRSVYSDRNIKLPTGSTANTFHHANL